MPSLSNLKLHWLAAAQNKQSNQSSSLMYDKLYPSFVERNNIEVIELHEIVLMKLWLLKYRKDL